MSSPGSPDSAPPESPSSHASSSGTPARAARRCSCAARASAGCPNGTPSSADESASRSAESPRCNARARFSSRLISSQLRLTSSAPEHGHVGEYVRVPPHQLGHDPVHDVIDREARAIRPLGRDPRVEHHLQQHVAEFLAEVLLIPGLQGLERLVRLLEQVRGERFMCLPGVPGALATRSRSMVATRSRNRAPGRSADPRTTRAPSAKAAPYPARAATPHQKPKPATQNQHRPRPGTKSPPRPARTAADDRPEPGRPKPTAEACQADQLSSPVPPAGWSSRQSRAGRRDDQQAGACPEGDGVAFAAPEARADCGADKPGFRSFVRCVHSRIGLQCIGEQRTAGIFLHR